MTAFFFDTSALVKRYVPEIGSQWVQSTIAPSAGHTIFISQITPVEVMSSLTRRRREGTLSTRSLHAAKLILNRHVRRDYFTILLIPEVIEKAQDLLERYPLRAADAMQLGCAIQANTQFTQEGHPGVIFVCSDSRLLLAAAEESLQIHEPGE